MNRIVTLTLIVLFSGCVDKSKTNVDIVRDYYRGLNQQDFKLVSSRLANNVLTKEIDYIVSENLDEIYVIFQWDSVFNPIYKIINLERISDDTISAVISRFCKRVNFLQDTSLTYKTIFIFEDNEIVQIETVDFIFLNYDTWGSRRDSLVSWISESHKDLDGFIYDLTPSGAVKYIKAIELYENRK